MTGILAGAGHGHPNYLSPASQAILSLIGGGVPGFFLGEVVTLASCFDPSPGAYCSVQGGGVVSVGVIIGSILAITGYHILGRFLRKA